MIDFVEGKFAAIPSCRKPLMTGTGLAKRPGSMPEAGLLSLLAGACMSVSSPVSAGSLLDYIRNYDLNDYALGVALTSSQSAYVNSDPTTFAYPYLTSFRHNSFTDDWLLIEDGGIGARWVSDSGWYLGGIGRLATNGTGSIGIDDLLSINDRKWAVELAPLVGYRAWPVHLDLRVFRELFDRHDGVTGELRFSYPMEFGWGYVVPSYRLTYYDETYTNYYYGVTPPEALPPIGEYAPGAALNRTLRVTWGYAIADKWLLTGHVGSEWLDSEISDSPLVNKDQLWSVNVGVAYNADVFQTRDVDGVFEYPDIEIRAGAFRNDVETTVIRQPTDGGPTDEVEVEEILGTETQRAVLQLDAIVRIAKYHRLELGHFQLGRASTITLERDVDFGDVTFPEGATVDTTTESRVTRLAYGFSLMNDAQKELGVMAGVHVSKVEVQSSSNDTGQSERSEITAVLPVVGAFGHVGVTRNWILAARLHVFRLQFDNYKGSMNYLHFGLQRSFGEHLGVGLGYNYYSMNLDSNDAAVNGTVRITHRGPILFASALF